jgi:hypothetical protein
MNLPEDSDLELLINKVVEEAEHGDRELFDSLTDGQKEYLCTLLNELAEEGSSPLLNLLWEIDYKEKPVDINTFLKDPYYMGNFYDQLFPKWRDEELPRIFSDPNIWQLVFTGAIGGGKTFCATLCQVYKLYMMSCLRNPHKFYGLAEGSPIVIGLFNVHKYKVETSSWGYMEAFIEKCPYFREKYTRDPKKTTEIRFPNNIQVIAGSTELHALGNNVYGCLIDEVDFMRKAAKGEEDEVGQAYKLHNALVRRIKSRFMIRGNIPGLLAVCSSKTSQSGYVETLVNEQRRNPDPSVYIVDEPIWGYKPKENYSGKKFKIFVGDKYRSAKILDKEDPTSDYDISSVIDVPVEHRADFEKDIEMAIRDVAGVATYSIRPFIPDREMIYKCIDHTRQHPFTRLDLPITIEDLDTEILDYLDYRKILAVDRSSYKPLVNPGARRFVHIDIGLTEDALGFCMGHLSHNELVEKTDAGGFKYTAKIPHIYIDLAFRLVPNGSRIDLQKMRNFVYALRDFGFKIHDITLDGYQSEDSVQQFIKSGFTDCKVLSVDRKETPYVLLRQAILESRISYYEHPKLILELSNLQRDAEKKKIDHPKEVVDDGKKIKGSKDLSDAVAGVVFHAMRYAESIEGQSIPLTKDQPKKTPTALGNPKSWLLSDYDNLDEIIGIL